MALRSRKRVLEADQVDLSERKVKLDSQRERHLKILTKARIHLKNLKPCRRLLVNKDAQLLYLEQQRDKLEQVAETARVAREAGRDRGRIVDEIKAMVTRPKCRLLTVRRDVQPLLPTSVEPGRAILF